MLIRSPNPVARSDLEAGGYARVPKRSTKMRAIPEGMVAGFRQIGRIRC